jgi:hypothetical protein
MTRSGTSASIAQSHPSWASFITVRNGAYWLPGLSTNADVPFGFDNMGSLSLYFEFGPGALGFSTLYKVSWVSPLTAVLAYSSKQAAPNAADVGALTGGGLGAFGPKVSPPSGGGRGPTGSGVVPGCLVMYTTVSAAAQAWFYLEQLSEANSPTLQPMVSAMQCSALGLGVVAIALKTPGSLPVWQACGWFYNPDWPASEKSIKGSITQL